MVSAIDSGFN
jgi:aspartate/methionine/tyrosine aminotransferase